MSEQTMMWDRTADVIVSVHSKANRPPTNAEWNAFLDFCEKAHGEGVHCLLVFTDGAGPNAPQRATSAEMHKRLHGAPMRTAVVTPASAIMRGIVTALSWLTRVQTRAFAPEELQAAHEFLELSAASQSAALELRDRMQSALDLGGAPRATGT